MTTIISNIIIVLTISINIFINLYYIKQIYTNYKNCRKQKKIEQNEIKAKKLVLYKNLEDLKHINLNTKLYANLTKNQQDILLNAVEELKNDEPEIYLFASELLKNVKIDNLRHLLINSKQITIHYHPSTQKNKIAGTYNSVNKQIDIYDKQNSDTLYHELLHASSSHPIFNNVGFKIVLKQGGILGEGLNEGYTEILNKRFFHNKNDYYPYLQKLSLLIEKFYDNKEEMIEDYFNADIFKLIGQLLKYMSLEEIIDIIVDMDWLLNSKQKNYLDYLKIKNKILKIYHRSHQYKQNNNTHVKTKTK